MPKYDLHSLKTMTQMLVEQEMSRRGESPQSKRSGAIYYRCAFHAERSASMAVHPEFFKCHACEARGDVVDFFGLLRYGTAWNPRDKAMFIETVKNLGATTADDSLLERFRQERMAKAAAEAAVKATARNKFNASHIWERWHNSMDAAARQLWSQRGLTEANQDRWQVGYTPRKVYNFNGDMLVSPAMTIPVFTWANGVPSMCVTANYRLLSPVAGAGKYRFTPTCGTQAWVSHPHLHAGDGDECLVAEGSIKAAVASQLLEDRMQTIGIPSMSDPGGILKDLTKFKRVWIWLDPGVENPPKNAKPDWKPFDLRYALALQAHGVDARFVRYPVTDRAGNPLKLDDAILAGKIATAQDLLEILRWARKR